MSGESVWACSHHATASLYGYGLQTQRFRRLTKTVNANIVEETLDILSEEEDSPKAVIEMEPDVKKLRKNKLTRGKKSKTTPEDVEDLIKMYGEKKK